MILKLRAHFDWVPFGFFSPLSLAEQDMLLRSQQHWYIFSSLYKNSAELQMGLNRHKATTQSHDQRFPRASV